MWFVSSFCILYLYSSNSQLKALDLLERLLVYNPKQRMTAAEALKHEYVRPYRDPADEPDAPEKFDWGWDHADLPIETWKVMIYSEVLGQHRFLMQVLWAR